MTTRTVALVALWLVVTACADDKQKVTWDEVGNAPEVHAAAKKAPETQPELDAAAAAALSATTCEEQARALLATDRKKGAMFMYGCMKRPDFTSLFPFTTPPWKGLRFTEAQYPMLLDVSMRRGGSEVAEDFAAIGIKVEPIDVFLGDDPQRDGTLVSLRVQPLSGKGEPDGWLGTARAYGYAGARGFRRGGGQFGAGSYYGEMRDVQPIGVTIELHAASSLPLDRRVQIIGRFRADRTKRLKAAQDRELAAFADSGIDPSKLEDKKNDPPPSLAFELVAVESSVSKGAVELPGRKNDPNDSFIFRR